MSDNTKPAAEQVAEIATEIRTVQTAVAGIDKINAGLAALELAHPKDVIIAAINTPSGMKAAIASRAAWRAPRLAVEQVRKEAKAPVLALGRAIDALAADLTTKLLAGEQHYDAQIKAEEARKEAEKAAKAKAEAERVERHTVRIGEIAAIAVGAARCTAAQLADHIAATERLEIGDDFEEFKPKAEATKAEVLTQLHGLHAAAAEREAEAARLAAEREELARLRAEQAKRDAEAAAARAEEERKAAEARAAQEREEAARRAQEQRAHEERMRAEREAHEAEMRRQREALAEQERLATATRAEADRIAREAREAEERRQMAAREEALRLEREAAEARRREEEARAEAEKRLHDAAAQVLTALMHSTALLLTMPGVEGYYDRISAQIDENDAAMAAAGVPRQIVAPASEELDPDFIPY